jgi:hypothetical protein
MAWMLALTLLVGGAAACSDDDGGDEATTEESDSGADAGSGSESDSGSEDGGEDSGEDGDTISRFCDAVEEYNGLVADGASTEELTDLGQELAGLASELAGDVPTMSPEDAERYGACAEDFQLVG